jgi:2-isopropylmalate synthase
MSMKKVFVYDTTLRDGAQAEGISFSGSGKVLLARHLDAFGIDYIEGGYAGSNQKDMEFFREIQRQPLSHAKVVAFGSTRRSRVSVKRDALVASLLEANTPAVTIVGKSWDLHVRDVLRTSYKENFNMISDTVGYIKEHDKEVFFDAEHFFDGFKADPDFAMAALDAAVRAGVDAVVLCDTNGGCLPHEIFSITGEVVKRFDVTVGIHVHNDMGLAVANTLEAVRAGARQVQGTINGYGERCGNADLCTIMPTLELKMRKRCVGRRRLRSLRELSMYVDDLVNVRHNPRLPYVGRSAFSHKAGPHVNAVQKNPVTFEHVSPEQVGNERHVLVSELSGGSSVLMKAIELGVGREESADGVRNILEELKLLESKGYAFEAADASFKILIQKILKKHRPFFDLDGFRVIVEKRGKHEPCISEATIKVRVGDDIEHTAAEGDGPVNALDKALRKVLTRFYPEIADVVLTDFRVRILDSAEATAARTRVLIESSDGDETWGTVGVSENIIAACWEALLDGVEYKLFKEESKRKSAPKKSK